MKSFLISFAIISLSAVILGRWYAYHQLVADRRAEKTMRDAVDRALAERICTDEFAGPEQRLADVLAKLASRSAVPIKINRAEADKTWLAMERKTHIYPGTITLEDLLTEVTGRCGLAWCRWGDSLVITSPSQADRLNAPLTRVYRLPADLPDGAPFSDDVAELSDMISTTIEPDSWDDVGGPGVLRHAGGAVVVHQTPEIQRQVAALLAGLEQGAGSSEKSFPLLPWPGGAEEPIIAALARKDSVDFVDEPLERVARILSERHSIPIVLATVMLADAAIRPDTPVTKKLENVSLRNILREILADLKLTYVIRDSVLQISTPEDAESQLVSRMYDVGDLLEPPAPPGFRPLIDLITTTIEPDSWTDVGGPGCISSFGQRWLVVSQTQDILDSVDQLLNSVRAVLASAGARKAWLTPPEPVATAVQSALGRPIRLSYFKQPLNEICRQLSEEVGVPILLRRAMLEDAAISEEAPITVDLPPLPLQQALKIILGELKLVFVAQGEVIHVTIPEDAESILDTCVLDVRHLTSPGAGGIDERTLARVVRASTGTDWWDDRGGPATLCYYRGLLVVSHVGEKQREIEHLVKSLSDRLQNRVASGKPESVWISKAEGEAKVIARLCERDSFKFMGGDFESAITRLFAAHSIPLHVRRSLHATAESARPDSPWEFRDVPLVEILTRVFADRQWGISFEGGAICATREDHEEPLLVRLYPVGPFWPGAKAVSGRQLAQYLIERVDVESWNAAGGAGDSIPLNDQWLLVAQSLDVHRKIEEGIEKLKEGTMDAAITSDQ